MSDEKNVAEPSEIGGDLKLLALSLGFAWPEDEAGRWRVLKLMAGMASHWRAKYSEVQGVTWRDVERERMYQHMRRRAVSLAAKVTHLRRCLRDYMAGQRVAVAEARAELMAAEASKAEVARLRDAIRRLAEQDATLSVCEGAVTVTMDATLTDAEREAVEAAIDRFRDWVNGTDDEEREATLRGLLARLA